MSATIYVLPTFTALGEAKCIRNPSTRERVPVEGAAVRMDDAIAVRTFRRRERDGDCVIGTDKQDAERQLDAYLKKNPRIAAARKVAAPAQDAPAASDDGGSKKSGGK